METARRAPEYTLEIFADPNSVKEVVKAVLHTIFFHRIFIPLQPASRDLLDLTLPIVRDNDLETLIDQRATSLVRAVDLPYSSANPRSGSQTGRAQVAIAFYETKKKKKSVAYFWGKPDEEICWESWVLDVTCATPRTETDGIKVRGAMEKSVHKAAMKIINIVNRDKDHIPPIMTGDANPFPYQITVTQKSDAPKYMNTTYR